MTEKSITKRAQGMKVKAASKIFQKYYSKKHCLHLFDKGQAGKFEQYGAKTAADWVLPSRVDILSWEHRILPLE